MVLGQPFTGSLFALEDQLSVAGSMMAISALPRRSLALLSSLLPILFFWSLTMKLSLGVPVVSSMLSALYVEFSLLQFFLNFSLSLLEFSPEFVIQMFYFCRKILLSF